MKTCFRSRLHKKFEKSGDKKLPVAPDTATVPDVIWCAVAGAVEFSAEC